MNEQEIHAHAVALWDELSEMIGQALQAGELAKHLTGDDLGLAPQVLEMFERKLQQVADEAQDDYYEDNRA